MRIALVLVLALGGCDSGSSGAVDGAVDSSVADQSIDQSIDQATPPFDFAGCTGSDGANCCLQPGSRCSTNDECCAPFLCVNGMSCALGP